MSSSKELLGALSGLMSATKGTVFQLNLTDPKVEWVIDVGNHSVYNGKAPKADVTLSMKESDFMDLVRQKANPTQLFMGGKIKFKGNMALLMKLQQLQTKAKL